MLKFSRVLAGLAVTCCLVLSACSGGPGSPGGPGGQGGDGSEKTEAPVYTWGDWADLGFTANLELANDSYAAFLNSDDMTHAVYDTSRNKVWDVPTLKPITMSVYNTWASDELFIAEVENGDLVGFNWADGAEKWRLNPADILQCDPSDAASWSVASRTDPKVDGESTIVLSIFDQDALDNGCRSAGDYPSSVAFDPKTGEEKWRGPNVNGGSGTVTSFTSVTGKYQYAAWGTDMQYQMSRTEVGSGETTYATVEKAHAPGFSIAHEVSDTGFVIAGGEPNEFVEVHTWSDQPGGDPIKAYPTTDFPVPYHLRNSQSSGYIYGFNVGPQKPNGSDLKYHFFNLTKPDSDTISPRSESYPTPEAPAIPGSDDAKGYEPHLWNDPLVPREGASPLIVLPGTSSPLVAFDYETGEPVWSVDGSDQISSTTYIAQTDEVIFVLGDEAIAVNAQTGEEKLREKFGDDVYGVDFFGGVMAVYHSDGTSIRALKQH